MGADVNAADIFGAASSSTPASASMTPAWPAPLAPVAYHGPIGAVVRALEPETEADPAAILIQMLVMFGNVVGRGPSFAVGADVHHLNLFAGIVGETGKARKGVSRGQAQRIFGAVDADWTARCTSSGLSSGEGLIWTVRDAIETTQPVKEKGRVIDYQTVVEDSGVADKRLLVVESELASTLKVMAREGNTLSPVVRQAWDGLDLRVITKSSPARATAPHISIIGHITKDELRRYLSATEVANGFGNRFLWVCARRSKELPDGGRTVDLTRHASALTEAVRWASGAGTLTRDAEAGALWHRLYGRLSAGRPGMVGAMTNRAEAQVMRLACLYAVGDMSYVVRPAHLHAGLAVWRYCFDSAVFLFGDRLGDPIADDILLALRHAYPESLTRSYITRDLFGRNRPAHDVDRALQLLRQHRLATAEVDHSGEGRPVERWVFVESSADDIDDIDDISPAADGGSVVNVVNVVRPAGESGVPNERY